MKGFIVGACKGANWIAGLMAGGVMTGSVYGCWMRAADKKGLSDNWGTRTIGYGVAGITGTIAGAAIAKALNKVVEDTFEEKKE